MNSKSGTPNDQVKQLVAGISAQLAQLAKDPPDLTTYLRAHAHYLNLSLKPKGLSYEILGGNNFKRIFSVNFQDLDLKDNPVQEESFRKAVRQVADTKQPMVLDAHNKPTEGKDVLGFESAVSAENLKLFNNTPYQQIFVPIPLNSKVAGVLQAWFEPAGKKATNTRVLLLKHFCEEIVIYLRSRRATDLSQEITRINTYSHLLEDLAGDLNLDSVAWSVVNYARETVDCERVSIFYVKKYPRHDPDSIKYEILACSGLKRPHTKSEQAEILKELVESLANYSLNSENNTDGHKTAVADISDQGDAGLTSTIQENVKPDKTEKPVPEGGKQLAPALPAGERPQFRLVFTYRESGKEENRPDAVNQYFDAIPMNWATTIPLFDRESNICGILLFEGQKDPDKVKSTFMQMRDLAYSGGRALGTSLYWHNRRFLRIAHGVARIKTRYTKTRGRRLLTKVLTPIVILTMIMCLPVSFKIRGGATLRPTSYQSLPAMVASRVLEVLVKEGDDVSRGELLAVLDSRDLRLQLQQAEQEYQRYMAESDLALNMGNEIRMQVAQLNAWQSAALADKFRYELSLTEIRAPFDGMVVGPLNLSMRVGQMLKIGDPVLEMAEPGKWEVKIEVREQDIIYLDRMLRENDTIPMEIKFNADPTRIHHLEVNDPSQLAYGLETSSGKYAFALVVPFNDISDTEELKMGYSGRATFKTGRRALAFVLFRDFLHFLKMRVF